MSLTRVRNEFLDEPGQPRYNILDVVVACPEAAEAWKLHDHDEVPDHYFCVCYGELCCYPKQEGEPGWVWDFSNQLWHRLM